jgi:hypothetical protein
MSIDDHWFQDCHDFILGLMITTYIKGYLRLRKNNVCHLIHHHPLIWQTKTSWQVDHQDHLMVSMYIYIFDCFTLVTSWVIWIFKIWTEHYQTRNSHVTSATQRVDGGHVRIPQVSTSLNSKLLWIPWPLTQSLHKCQAPFPTQGTGTRGTCNRACPFSRCTLLVRRPGGSVVSLRFLWLVYIYHHISLVNIC